ncbi:adenylate cyclase [Bacterioplanes sanyensis]|nr:adenylate cyclase [Bacterioplanes sanyensis]
MTPRQQLVLNALPLLLHINHPRLPGFIHHKVIAGISQFSATSEQQQALQQLARGISLPRSSYDAKLHGVYLMGSVGSVAQSSSSDLDVWLCHDEALAQDELAELQDKCALIESWAKQQGCELHIFLMNLSEFRQGQHRSAEGEDCGSTQHILLLDEFYRSAVWLAGRQPRWWLIPNEYERKAELYWQFLVNEMQVHPEQWLDFGAIPTIPVAEFIGAALWQLSKGLSAPYKALLKLLLNRHYASQYPNIRPLCWDLKDQVHAGNADANECDAYILVLRRISEQLAQEGNQQRIELARRAFYFKAHLRLTQLSRQQSNSWRAQTLNQLTQEWGWNKYQLEDLDQREQWWPTQVAQERHALISEMLSSYRLIANFSQKHSHQVRVSRRDMRLLGNRLYAAFDARPGKILDINPGIVSNLGQETLHLNLCNNDDQHPNWQLVVGHWQEQQIRPQQVLKQSPSLMELLCFAQFNGLVTPHTRLRIHPTNNPLSSYHVQDLLQRVLALHHQPATSSDLQQPAQPCSWHLFINVGIDPQHQLSRRGMQKVSNRDDALGYSAAHDNLIMTVDLLTINSWGEWHLHRFSGEAAMLNCLQHLLQWLPLARRQGWPSIVSHSLSRTHAGAIAKRVEQLLADVLPHFAEHPRSPYLIEVAEQYYLLECQHDGPKLLKADSSRHLLQLLRRPREQYTAYVFDRAALPGSPLRWVFERSRRGLWQLFYWHQKQMMHFYFLDERGALLHHSVEVNDTLHPVLPVLRFLRQLDQRWQLQQQRSARKLMLFELKRRPNSHAFELKRKRLPEVAEQTASIDLRAILDQHQQPTLYCNSEEFSIWQYGHDLYTAVAAKVMQLRSPGSDYPCYLTDVELSGNDQVIDHLNAKFRLEQQLNLVLNAE